jgi:hypothetical protein
MPLMMTSHRLTPPGTFWFLAAVTLLGLAWMWLFLPETAGWSLEGMDELFCPPWHVIGHKGASLTACAGNTVEAYHGKDVEKVAEVLEVKVEDVKLVREH